MWFIFMPFVEISGSLTANKNKVTGCSARMILRSPKTDSVWSFCPIAVSLLKLAILSRTMVRLPMNGSKWCKFLVFILCCVVCPQWLNGDPLSAAPSPCQSSLQGLGDSAAWASQAVKNFAQGQHADAIATVDACFSQWGPQAGHQQKRLHDKGKKCPRTGKVSNKAKAKIQENYLMNDVSMALWAKARSLHALGKDELAKQAYGQCIFMTCGRAWDPKGWFWSPAEDCAEQVQDLL